MKQFGGSQPNESTELVTSPTTYGASATIRGELNFVFLADYFLNIALQVFRKFVFEREAWKQNVPNILQLFYRVIALLNCSRAHVTFFC